MKTKLEMDKEGNRHWCLNGERHREDGPTIEYSDGSKWWYLNNKRHRVNGPAIEWANGDKAWYLNGKRHREDGPAVEWNDGSKYWYLDGVNYTEEKYKELIQKGIDTDMIDPKQIKVEINRQGAPIVGDAVIYHQDNKIAIIEVNMESKWCQIDYTTGRNSIGIGVTDRSYRLDETKDKESDTEICFPEFKEYETWTCDLNRYTIRICLVKNIYEE